ncbi:MAG: FecR family protein [Flavobacteriales bacterium]
MDKKDILNQVIDSLKLPQGKPTSEAWSELQVKLEKAQEVPVRNIRPSGFKRAIPFIAAASVAILVMLVFPNKQMSTIEYATSSKEFKSVILEDGTQVQLSPNSEIAVDYSTSYRTVELKGEGFFEVQKGVPFTVITEQGEVTVLGTSFNVNSRKELLDVKCFTGSVNVKTEKGNSTLTKGLGLNSLSTEIYMHNSLNKSVQNGSLIFDKQPLNLILEDLKHHKGFEIVNTSDINPIISFEVLNESISEISEVLGKITSLQVKVVGGNKIELY